MNVSDNSYNYLSKNTLYIYIVTPHIERVLFRPIMLLQCMGPNGCDAVMQDTTLGLSTQLYSYILEVGSVKASNPF